MGSFFSSLFGGQKEKTAGMNKLYNNLPRVTVFAQNLPPPDFNECLTETVTIHWKIFWWTPNNWCFASIWKKSL